MFSHILLYIEQDSCFTTILFVAYDFNIYHMLNATKSGAEESWGFTFVGTYFAPNI